MFFVVFVLLFSMKKSMLSDSNIYICHYCRSIVQISLGRMKDMMMLGVKRNLRRYLTLKAPITTAADDKS